MVDSVSGVRGPTGPEHRPNERSASRKESAPPRADKVEISEGARLAKDLERLVQFAKSAPDVRPEAVRAARADLDGGVLFSDEVTQIVADKIVQASAELDDVVDPTAFFRAEFGYKALIGQRDAAEVLIPSVFEKQVVLKKVDVSEHVIEDHHVKPVGIVVVIEGNGRPCVDNRFVGVVGIEFVTPFFPDHIHIVHPVVVQGGDHVLRAELE